MALPSGTRIGNYQPAGTIWSAWDVMPDGQSFLLMRDHGHPCTSLSLVQNWFEELKKK